MPSQNVERSQSTATSVIQLVMIIASIVGFMWCIKHGIEESFTPRHTISKPLNK